MVFIASPVQSERGPRDPLRTAQTRSQWKWLLESRLYRFIYFRSSTENKCDRSCVTRVDWITVRQQLLTLTVPWLNLDNSCNNAFRWTESTFTQNSWTKFSRGPVQLSSCYHPTFQEFTQTRNVLNTQSLTCLVTGRHCGSHGWGPADATNTSGPFRH